MFYYDRTDVSDRMMLIKQVHKISVMFVTIVFLNLYL